MPGAAAYHIIWDSLIKFTSVWKGGLVRAWRRWGAGRALLRSRRPSMVRPLRLALTRAGTTTTCRPRHAHAVGPSQQQRTPGLASVGGRVRRSGNGGVG